MPNFEALDFKVGASLFSLKPSIFNSKVTNIKIRVPLSFFKIHLFFSTFLQMALVPLPKAFKSDLPNFQQIGSTRHLGAEVTNINIWVSFSLSHNFLHFSRITNGPRTVYVWAPMVRSCALLSKYPKIKWGCFWGGNHNYRQRRRFVKGFLGHKPYYLLRKWVCITSMWWSFAGYDLAIECNSVGPWNINIWVGRDPNLFVFVVCGLSLCRQLVQEVLESGDLYMSYLHFPSNKKHLLH